MSDENVVDIIQPVSNANVWIISTDGFVLYGIYLSGIS